MITIEDYWMGRDKTYSVELTDEIRKNAAVTVARANDLLERAGLGELDYVASGWRPKSINDFTANAGKGSRHLTGQAIDIGDPDRRLARWCATHYPILEELGLWLEHPGWTPSWVHLQTIPPASGKRCYIPSNSPSLDPTFRV